MKKIMATFMTALLIGTTSFQDASVVEAAAPSISVKMNNHPVFFPDVEPFVDAKTNRTMVPLRAVSVAMNLNVGWDDKTKTVSLETVKGTKKITLVVGEKKATVNGKEVEVDAPSMIKNERTYVPLRFVSEALGGKVTWDDKKKLVDIKVAIELDYEPMFLPRHIETEPVVDAFLLSLKFNEKARTITGKIPKIPAGYGIYFSFVDAGVAYKDLSHLKSGESFTLTVKGKTAKIGFTVEKNNTEINTVYIDYPSGKVGWSSKR